MGKRLILLTNEQSLRQSIDAGAKSAPKSRSIRPERGGDGGWVPCRGVGGKRRAQIVLLVPPSLGFIFLHFRDGFRQFCGILVSKCRKSPGLYFSGVYHFGTSVLGILGGVRYGEVFGGRRLLRGLLVAFVCGDFG